MLFFRREKAAVRTVDRSLRTIQLAEMPEVLVRAIPKRDRGRARNVYGVVARGVASSHACGTYLSMISTKRVADHDPSLDALLDLDGQRFTIEPSGHSVKFAVRRVPVTSERPQGINYSLTLHAPDGRRLVGFDNAHVVRASRGPAGARRELDHRHRLGTTRPYRYSDAGKLLEDFWREVYAVLDELGVER